MFKHALKPSVLQFGLGSPVHVHLALQCCCLYHKVFLSFLSSFAAFLPRCFSFSCKHSCLKEDFRHLGPLALLFLTVLVPLFLRTLTITARGFVQSATCPACALFPSLQLYLCIIPFLNNVIFLLLRLGLVGQGNADLRHIFGRCFRDVLLTSLSGSLSRKSSSFSGNQSGLLPRSHPIIASSSLHNHLFIRVTSINLCATKKKSWVFVSVNGNLNDILDGHVNDPAVHAEYDTVVQQIVG